jgi:hypothetical protein
VIRAVLSHPLTDRWHNVSDEGRERVSVGIGDKDERVEP